MSNFYLKLTTQQQANIRKESISGSGNNCKTKLLKIKTNVKQSFFKLTTTASKHKKKDPSQSLPGKIIISWFLQEALAFPVNWNSGQGSTSKTM